MAQVTTDHDEIRKWVEARSGRPAAVHSTQSKDGTGIIRIEFPNAPNAKDDNLEEITWTNSSRSLTSRTWRCFIRRKPRAASADFNKLVGRETAEAREDGETHASRHHGRR